MVTPFLKKLSSQGGSLYVFPSASKDLTRTFVSNDYEFKFSHFACLNLPPIHKGQFSDISDKGLYIEKLLRESEKETINWSDQDAVSKLFVENLQNYVMNFETAILNGEGDNDDYDPDILTTVSEKVFFNWLQKVNAIKFDGNTELYNKFSERTVQYIGDIDVTNTVEIGGDTFEELYIHIPCSVGASTNIYFRKGIETDNKNYLNKNYEIGKNGEYIIGRYNDDNNFESIYGLSIKSMVDDDNEGNIYIGDEGYTIDFRDSSYSEGISTMNERSLESFQFNAILIYYDFLEKTNISNVKKIATNLYGILFLEEMTLSNEIGILGAYPKVKETIYGNGNSFALKVDLKIDTTPDTSSTVNFYNDPNEPLGMMLYEKSMTQLQKCIDIFYEQKKEITKLKERISTLETLIMGIDTVNSLKQDITNLYNLIYSNGVVSNDTILELIDVNSQKLNTILNGGKNIKLQYDTDVLQSGTGVSLEKSLNKVIINASQGYAINKIYSDINCVYEITDSTPLDPSEASANCYMNLQSGENFTVLYIDDAGQYSTPIEIYVSDNEHNWKVGQSLKIYLKSVGDDLTLNLEDSYGINIHIVNNLLEKTDVDNITIMNYELEGAKCIDLICMDTNKFIYLITK